MKECWMLIWFSTKGQVPRGKISTWIFVSSVYIFPFKIKIKTNILVFWQQKNVFQVSFLTYGTWPFDLHISKHLHYIHKRWKQTHNGMIFFWRIILMHLYFHITVATVLNPALLNTLCLDKSEILLDKNSWIVQMTCHNSLIVIQ